MLKSYTNIGLVYGQSTKGLANKFKDVIDKYQKAGYPIRPKMLQDFDFVGKEKSYIDQIVKDVIGSTDYAIIFLGRDGLLFKPKDEQNSLSEEALFETYFPHNATSLSGDEFKKTLHERTRYRASQNVIFEAGLLWGTLGLENVQFILTFPYSEINTRFDLPSDIPSNLYFQKIKDNDNHANVETMNKIVENIIDSFNLSKNNEILFDTSYQIDYNALFTPDELIEINGQPTNRDSFDKIASIWHSEIASLMNDKEKIIYIFERLVFIPNFPNDAAQRQGLQWAEYSLSLISQKISEEEKQCYKALKLILEYITLGGNQENAKINLYRNYIYIAEELNKIKNKLSGEQNYGINPIIKVYLNDYIGLSYRKAFEHSRQSLEDTILKEYLVKSIDSLTASEEIANANTREASLLWRGYSLYNRARTYKFLYEITNDEEDLNKAKIDLKLACDLRETWTEVRNIGAFPNVFGLSFKAEYIFAATDSLKKNNNVENVASKNSLYEWDIWKNPDLVIDKIQINAISINQKHIESLKLVNDALMRADEIKKC